MISSGKNLNHKDTKTQNLFYKLRVFVSLWLDLLSIKAIEAHARWCEAKIDRPGWTIALFRNDQFSNVLAIFGHGFSFLGSRSVNTEFSRIPAGRSARVRRHVA